MIRTIEKSSIFKRDYKRELKGKHRKTLETDLITILKCLVSDMPLPQKNKDHELIGNWSGYRECHIKPDLLLIYDKSTPSILKLARIGSHSKLFS